MPQSVAGRQMSQLALEQNDTILAVSSPAGAAARAIIRLSGPASLRIVSEIFSPSNDQALDSMRTYTAVEGRVEVTRTVSLPGTVYIMKAPYSYTREDVVEIHTIGSPPLVQRILELLLAKGTRMAQPGEFTRRAYLNGRIDLAQAESVISIIKASSEDELRLAAEQLRGSLSTAALKVQDELADLCSKLELGLDFSDQDIEPYSTDELLDQLNAISTQLESLRRGGGAAKWRADAVRAVIFGPPNVGKSSLLNSLGVTRPALVSRVSGTTRDFLEESIEIGRVMFRFTDTAGIRNNITPVEKMAVERAHMCLQAAQIVLFVVDVTRPPGPDELELMKYVQGKKLVLVLNKVDLLGVEERTSLTEATAASLDEKRAASPKKAAEMKHPYQRRGKDIQTLRTLVELIDAIGPHHVVTTSALTGEGIATLKDTMLNMVTKGEVSRSASHFVLNARHRDALRRAKECLGRARKLLSAQGQDVLDISAFEIREAMLALGEIAGHVTPEDVLNRIFEQFCIGK